MPTLFDPLDLGEWKLPNRALNQPNPATFYASSGPEGYTDYPFLDRAVRSA